MFTAGLVNDAWSRVRNNEFFSQNANLTLENLPRFWEEILIDLSGNQADICGVALEHIKRHVSYEDPWDNLARMRDIQKYLATSP